MLTADVQYTAWVICISFAFSVLLLGSLPTALHLTDGNEDDENDDLYDDANRRPDCSKTICIYINTNNNKRLKNCDKRPHRRGGFFCGSP